MQTAGEPAAVLAAIPDVMKRLDPDLPIESLEPVPQVVQENVFVDRFLTMLSAAEQMTPRGPPIR